MIHAWGITDKGAVRTQNQDGFYLDVPSEHLAVGVVCDGMGGAKAGNIASLIAVETFVDALQGMQPDGDGEAGPAAVLSRAAETANTAVYHRAVTDPDCRGMGTTMVAALVVEQTAYLLNISVYGLVNSKGIINIFYLSFICDLVSGDLEIILCQIDHRVAWQPVLASYFNVILL